MVIIGVFLAAGVLSLIYVTFFLWSGKPSGVIIESDGKIFAQYEFNTISGKKSVEIKSDYGYNVVELENRRIRIVHSDCADQICTGAGWIDRPNQVIVCLPARLVVRLTGGEGVDYVSY